SSRRRHTRFSRDWSSDVCSSDLGGGAPGSMGTTAVTTRLGLLSTPASPRTVLREDDGVALQPGHGVGECSSPCALAIEVQAALRIGRAAWMGGEENWTMNSCYVT